MYLFTKNGYHTTRASTQVVAVADSIVIGVIYANRNDTWSCERVITRTEIEKRGQYDVLILSRNVLVRGRKASV